MVGGSPQTINREGPWPACVGMAGATCSAMILSMATDLQAENIIIMDQDSFMTMDFRTDRVRIMVNEQGVVTRIPGRG